MCAFCVMIVIRNRYVEGNSALCILGVCFVCVHVFQRCPIRDLRVLKFLVAYQVGNSY